MFLHLPAYPNTYINTPSLTHHPQSFILIPAYAAPRTHLSPTQLARPSPISLSHDSRKILPPEPTRALSPVSAAPLRPPHLSLPRSR